MQWFYFAISSVALFTSLELLQRKMSVDSKYPRAMSVVFNLWGGLIAIIIFISVGGYKNFSLPHDPSAWIVMVFAFLMYAMFERNRFLVSKLLEASVNAIISNLGLVVAFIGSIFLYSEPLTISKIIGTILIIASLILVSTAGKIKKISMKGVLLAVTIYLFLGVGWLLDKRGAILFNPNTYQLIGWTIPVIFIYFPYVKSSEIAYEAKRLSWKIVLLASINVFGYYFQLRALATGQATVVLPLIQTFMLATVILGIILLGEKDHLWRKVFAALIGLAGAYFLVTA